MSPTLPRAGVAQHCRRREDELALERRSLPSPKPPPLIWGDEAPSRLRTGRGSGQSWGGQEWDGCLTGTGPSRGPVFASVTPASGPSGLPSPSPHPVLVEVQFSINNSESYLHPPIRQGGCCLARVPAPPPRERWAPDTTVSRARTTGSSQTLPSGHSRVKALRLTWPP